MKHEVRMQFGELKRANIGIQLTSSGKPEMISFRLVDKDGNAITIETTPSQARDIANQVNTKVGQSEYTPTSYAPWT
jgi:hypothetical protein